MTVPGDAGSAAHKPQFEALHKIDFHGHSCGVQVQSLPPFEAGINREKPLVVLISFLGISALLVAPVWSMLLSRHRARRAHAYADALADSEEQSRAVFQNALDAFITIDAGGRILEWNPQAAAIFGWSMAAVLGKNISDIIIPPRFRQAHRTGMRRFLETGENAVLNRRIEITAQRHDGNEFPVELAIVQINLKNQWIFSSSLRDISDKKRAETKNAALPAELENRVVERTAQLEAANRELETFSYTVSHDLRSPLRAISGFTRILGEDFGAQLPQEAQRYFNLISDNAKRMAQLLDDLLAFSRLGRRTVAAQTVNLRQLAADALEEVRQGSAPFAATVQIADLPAAQGDSALLRQVFVNLLSNAVKFRAR